MWPNCNILPTNGIYLKFSMSKFPGDPKSGPKIGGSQVEKKFQHLTSTFFTPGSRALSCPSYQVPRQIYLEDVWEMTSSVVDGFLQKFPGGEYRPNQFKWKQTIGNLKLTASLHMKMDAWKTRIPFGTAYFHLYSLLNQTILYYREIPRIYQQHLLLL